MRKYLDSQLADPLHPPNFHKSEEAFQKEEYSKFLQSENRKYIASVIEERESRIKD